LDAVTASDDGPPATAAAGPRRALVFIGFMGAGKSSAARSAAASLGGEPLDSDRELERELGESLEAFFDREGEHAFRAREEETVLRLLARPDARAIALGGGSLGSSRVREALREHTVVLIEVDPEQAWRRASGKGRPLARDPERFAQLHRDRRAIYEANCDAIIPPSDRGVIGRALEALEALRTQAPPGTKLVWAESASGGYPVFAGRGRANELVWPRQGRRFIVTDVNVARDYPVGGDWPAAVIEPGETNKNLRTVESVLSAMARAGVTREDALVAVGGGVVGDLAGLCAAIYQRGISLVHVPTTLLAQVDSALGGKTGVDLAEAKNYAGAFHPPIAVLVDHAARDTLPAEERAAGYAEVVKTALIAGGSLWAKVRQGGEPDDDVVLGCIRTKLAIVAQDEHETGLRQVLNLGHTVAHAIESGTGYARYRHGEAVAVGLLCALRLSGRDALRREVAELLRDHGLPTQFEGLSTDEVIELVGRDKKRRGGRVPFVLVDAPGEVTPGHEVDDDALRAAIDEVRAR
jgi:shikimate kinase/3-dehydroquinate synthase